MSELASAVAIAEKSRVRRLEPTFACRRCTAVIRAEDMQASGLAKLEDHTFRHSYHAKCPGCGQGYDIALPPGVELMVGEEAAAKGTLRRPSGSERNEPCPCGSGLKWKKCHPEGVRG